MKKTHPMISRRAFLKGAGTVAISLPFMEFMLTKEAFAGGAIHDVKRLITVFFANGCPPELWLPDKVGSNFEFKPALSALEKHKAKLAVVSGLHDPAGKDGSGDDHSRGSGAFGVGVANPFLSTDAFDNDGKRYASSAGGVSLEQFAYQQLVPNTYLPSLEIGLMRGMPFSRTYHIKSWRGVNKPNPPLLNPLNTFHRIFGYAKAMETSADQAQEHRNKRYQQSILDTVVSEYRRVSSERYGLDSQSRAMLGDHLDAVRDLERRVVAFDAGMLEACQVPEKPQSYADMRFSDYAEVFKLQAELLAMALRCDITRFASVMIGSGAEGLKLPGLEQGQHELGHQWSANPDNDFIRYTRFQMQLVSYLLEQLDHPAYKDANSRTVLDNSVVFIGTEISHPSRHDHDEMMYLIAGAKGAIRTGYHHRVGDGTNRAVNDLHAACLRAIGLDVYQFGDPRYNQVPLNLS